MKKKVLIISYFYPPCSLTASQRTQGWFEHLPKNQWYPMVVSRKWEKPLKIYLDEAYPTSPETEVNVGLLGMEVRVAYKSSLRDKIYLHFGKDRMVGLRKLLTAVNLIVRNLHIQFSPYRNMYKAALKTALEEKPDAIIVSGNPFNQFYIGYKIHKKTGIPWIADYRDAWTTSELLGDLPKVFTWVNAYHRFFEKKWCSTASLITSVSLPLAERIGLWLNKPYAAIPNGVPDGLFAPYAHEPKSTVFTITYLGSLYPTQNIEFFLEAYLKFIEKHKLLPKDSRLLFPGLEIFPEQKQRILNFHHDLHEFIQTTERLPQADVLKIQKQSHGLLYVGWKGFKGVVPSKIFEYCASGTPVLVAPADESEVDKIVARTNTGISACTQAQVVEWLDQLYQAHLQKQPIQNNMQSAAIRQLNKSEQARLLAELLNRLTTT